MIKMLPAKYTLLAGVAVASFFAGVEAASSQTLNEALASTYTNNPTLLAARAGVRSDDEGVAQALSNWRPDIELSGDLERSRNKLNTRANQEQLVTPRNYTLDVSQPLFRGFRTIAGVDGAELDVKSARAALLGVEQDVLLSAATAYVAVVRDQAVLDLNINNEQVLRRQLEATQDRFRVGEITRTDVSQAEARLAGATADRIQAEGNLSNSRATYINIVGEAPGKLISPSGLTDLPADLEAVILTALKEHPDVLSSSYDEQSARENIKLVRGELLPSLNLNGTLSRSWESSTSNTRQDVAKIGVGLSVPLYQKGAVYSRLRAAKQAAGESLLELEESRRSAREAATSAWETLQTAKARIKSFTAQIKAAEIALEGVQREAAVGSRTVLDVLDAEQELLDAKVNLVGANRDEVVASFQLKESIGRLTAKNLGLPVEIYNPLQHYNEIRPKWFGSNSSGQDPKGIKK